MANAATMPEGHDNYITTLKTKYIRGIVSTSTATVCSHSSYVAQAGYLPNAHGIIQCDRKMEVVDNAGNVYYIPLFVH